MATQVPVETGPTHHLVTATPVRVTLDWSVDDETLLIVVSGEICAWSAPHWSRSLRVLIETRPCRSVTIEMAQVSFFSASGVSELLHLHRRLQGEGIRLSIGAVSPAVRRVTEIAGLDWIDDTSPRHRRTTDRYGEPGGSSGHRDRRRPGVPMPCSEP